MFFMHLWGTPSRSAPVWSVFLLPPAPQPAAGMTGHELIRRKTHCHSDRVQAALTFVKAQPVLVSYNVRQINCIEGHQTQTREW